MMVLTHLIEKSIHQSYVDVSPKSLIWCFLSGPHWPICLVLFRNRSLRVDMKLKTAQSNTVLENVLYKIHKSVGIN